MRTIVDTDIAIYLRDHDADIMSRVARLPSAPMLSVLSRIELEGGVYRDPDQTKLLRMRVDKLLEIMGELPFTSVEAAVYGRIVERSGYSRRRIVDRMIAATAIAADATLITINGADFRGIDGLKLEPWPAPRR